MKESPTIPVPRDAEDAARLRAAAEAGIRDALGPRFADNAVLFAARLFPDPEPVWRHLDQEFRRSVDGRVEHRAVGVKYWVFCKDELWLLHQARVILAIERGEEPVGAERVSV
jgi:hypothetical protein